MTLNEAFELMDRDPIKAPQRITVRPIRLKADNGGRCPTCGDRYFGCGHDEEEE